MNYNQSWVSMCRINSTKRKLYLSSYLFLFGPPPLGEKVLFISDLDPRMLLFLDDSTHLGTNITTMRLPPNDFYIIIVTM